MQIVQKKGEPVGFSIEKAIMVMPLTFLFTHIANLHELRDMRIALQVGAIARSPLQFGVCLRSSENYLVNDLGWLYEAHHSSGRGFLPTKAY